MIDMIVVLDLIIKMIIIKVIIIKNSNKEKNVDKDSIIREKDKIDNDVKEIKEVEDVNKIYIRN